MNQFLFLGTGASTGVPVVGCHCEVCASSNPYNKRLRPSGLLRWGGKEVLLDMGPDFRQQALRAGVERLDGVVLTHAHYDHIAGLDELRLFYFRQKRPTPLLASKSTFEEVSRRYDYMQERIDYHVLPSERGITAFLEIPIRYFTYTQVKMAVTGLRFDAFAYVVDICEFPDTVFEDLEGVETLVLSAFRFTPSLAHLTIDQAIDFARRVGAKQTYLVHMGHELDYVKGAAYLPEGIKLAYDGLEIEVK